MHSANDTLDAVCDHLNASTCAQRTESEGISWDSVPCAQFLQSMNTSTKKGKDEILMFHGGKCEVYWWVFVKNVTISEGFAGGK